VAPNQDSVAEMRVLTNGYQAEFGRNAGGTINLITKSGTKTFHGAGTWNYRHEDTNANDFFNNRTGVERPVYRYMIGSYAIGGPAYIPKVWNRNKNKLFFFLSQEFASVAQSANYTPNVSMANEPTAAEISGDFSQSRNSKGTVIPIINPTTGAPFPGNIVPSNMIDPVGQGLLQQLPKPNGYVNPAPGQQYTANFISVISPPYTRTDTIMRFDAAITDKLMMYYRYGKDSLNQTFPFTVAPGMGEDVNFLPGYVHGIHLAYTISPTMVNELSFGIGHDNYGFYHTTPDAEWFRTSSLNPPTLRPFPTGPLYENYLPCMKFSGGQASNPAYFTPGSQQGGGSCSLTPYKNFNDNYIVQDDLSKVHGNHSFKTGIYLEYNSKVEPSAGSTYMGNFNFGSSTNNPLDTGYGYANALLGIYQTYSEASNRAVPNEYYAEIDWYVQDSWRVRKNLTIDYGLRFVNNHPVSDNAKYVSDFYEQLWNAAQAPVLYKQGSVNGKSMALNPITGAYTYNSLVATIIPGTGSPIDGMHIDGLTGNGNFYHFAPVALAPRLGFAWDPFGDGKTAVRASAGIFYNRGYTSVPGGGSAPVVYTPTIYYGYVSQIPQAAASEVLSATSASAIYGNQKIEQVHEFNLTLQREIGYHTVVDVAYVGNFDRDASATIPLNPVPEYAFANPANLFNNTEINSNLVRQAYPGMGAITYTCYCKTAVNYNAFQMQVQHRLTHGLSFGASYTHSKALGVNSNFDGYHTASWFYGPVAQDRSDLLTWNFAYMIPSPSQNRIIKAALGGWTLAGTGIITTGAPLNPTCSYSGAAFPLSDPTESGGTARCEVVGNINSYQQSFFTNFNPNALTVAPVGTFGDAGYNILRQPTWWNFDASLDKKVMIKERVSMRFRFQAFNVFNHPEFNAIDATMSLNTAGQNLESTYGQFLTDQPARQIALTARFEF
jgi:hypothetical protein